MISLESIRIKLIWLGLTMLSAILAISGVGSMIIYNTSISETKDQLRATVKSNARMIDAMMAHTKQMGLTASQRYDTTLEYIKNAHDNFTFGTSGEFTLAKKEGKYIVFLLRNCLAGKTIPKPVLYDVKINPFAEPMRRALSGESGSMIGLDYRGVKVLAAYEPVHSLKLGIVAKIDMQEIYKPYLNAAAIVSFFAIAVVLFAMFVFFRLSQKISNSFIENTQQFYRLASNAKDVIYRMSLPEGKYQYVNQASSTVFGKSPQQMYDNPRLIRDLIHPQWLSYFDEQWEKLLAGNMPPTYEYQIITPEGTRWINQRNTLITDKNNKPIAIEGIVTDITELKEHSQTLLKEKNIAQQYLNITGTMMIALDEQGKIILFNRKACQVLKYTEVDALGKNWFDSFLPENQQQEVREVFVELIKGNVQVVEFFENKVCTSRGEERLIAWHNSVLKDNNNQIIGILSSGEDITERKQAEESFRGLFEHMPSGVAIYEAVDDGKDFIFKGFNSAAEKIEKRNRESLLGKRVTAIFPGVEASGILGVFQKVWKTGETAYLPEAFYQDESNKGWRESWTYKIPSGDVVTVYNDISERKQIEAELRHSEEKFRVLFEQAAVGVARLDPDGTWLEMNNKLCDIVGYSQKELLSKTFQDITYPDDLQLDLNYVNQLLKDKIKTYSMEKRYYKKNGDLIWINLTVSLVRDSHNNPNYFISIIEDITERKQSEDTIRKISLAVDQSPESIIITNINAEIEYVNESFLCATGYNREDIMGKNPRILHSGKTPKETYVDMWSKLTAGKPWKGELYNRSKDGREYIEFALITPLRQPDNTITHYVAIKEDITEKKILSQELDEHRHHLQDLVEKRTEQLQEAQHKAEAASESKTLFLANMSHEIRTPMNAILGLTQLLLKSEQNPNKNERLNKISMAGEHLLSLINDILDISKIEAGKLELEQINFKLETVFEQIKSLFNGQFIEKGLLFSVEALDFPLWLNGDPTRLRQALLNYLSNALKFTATGKITLRVKQLKELDNKLLLRFEVEDTGIGIESEKVKEIFQYFEQADSSTTRQFGGTGLGLSITKKLARLMGGDAGVESQLNQGSTFWFTAWFSPGKEELSSSAVLNIKELELKLQSDYAGARLLLVEDNDINREVAQGLLNDINLAVDTAINGREAVEKVQANNYDLVLMDVQMPEMDGLEATRQIRAIKEKINLPVLAMTAGVLDNEKKACITAGMNDFVSKPIELKNLYTCLIKWLPKGEEKQQDKKTDTELEHMTNASVEHKTIPDMEIIEALSSIMGLELDVGLTSVSGNLQMFVRLLRKFVATYKNALNSLNELLDKKQTEDAQRLVHSMKSSAGTLGLVDLMDIASVLEQMIKTGQPRDEMKGIMNQFESELTSIVSEVENLPF